MIGIYKITSPSGKVYIGKSINIEKRFKCYKYKSTKFQPLIHNSIKKYGIENHQFEIIHELPRDVSQKVLNDYEILYIELYKNCNIYLLNLTDGGEGLNNPNEITRKKMSNYSKNRSPEHEENNRKARCKIVLQYDLNGNFIKEWESLKEATSNNYGDIRSCLNGRQRYAGNSVWEYKHLKSDNIKEKIKNNLLISQQIEINRRIKISEFFKKKRLERTFKKI